MNDIEVLKKTTQGKLNKIILFPQEAMEPDLISICKVDDELYAIFVACKYLEKDYKKSFKNDTIVNYSQLDINQVYFKNREKKSEVNHVHLYVQFWTDFASELSDRCLYISIMLPYHHNFVSISNFENMASESIFVKLDKSNINSLVVLPFAQEIIQSVFENEANITSIINILGKNPDDDGYRKKKRKCKLCFYNY